MNTPLHGAVNEVERLFGRRDALVGMIHLHPLPGSPRYDPAQGMRFTLKVALEESELLTRAGFDGLIVENAWDIPFLPPDLVGPETAAAMAVVVKAIKEAVSPLPVGVNCLGNAVETSVAIAAATGAEFVRANQWVNAYVANEGLINGRAGVCTRYRRAIGADHVTVWADVQVKLGSHAITADRSLSEQARDAAFFDADALIVTGLRLADPPRPQEVEEVKNAGGLATVVGSGVTAENLASFLSCADAVIVGSSLKEGGQWFGEISPTAVADLARARDEHAASGRHKAIPPGLRTGQPA
jgi:membrane complex biogenesis BtpA family protein